MKKLLDVSSEETKKLQNIAERLEFYADSFYTTGNTIMGDKLIEISQEILNSEKKLNQVVAETIDQGFLRAQQSSVNVIKAALAVAKR